MTEFRFGFPWHYHEDVEKKLYDIQTHDLAIDHHVLQRKSTNSIYCLQCCTELEYPISKEALAAHFVNHNVTEEQMEAFEAYHALFKKFGVRQQLQQVFYQPVDGYSVKCTLCEHINEVNSFTSHRKTSTHYKNMKSHGRSYNFDMPPKKHNKKPQNNVNVDELNDLSTLTLNDNQPKPKTKKKQNRKRNNKPQDNGVGETDETDEIIKNDDCFDEGMIFHQCNQLVFCMICKMPVVANDGHETSENHLNSLDILRTGKPTKVLFNALMAYDAAWRTKLANVAEYKKYFVVQSKSAFRCLFCDLQIPIVNLLQHIENFPCVFLSAGDLRYDGSMNYKQLRADFVTKNCPKQTYPDEILEKFYSPRDFFDHHLQLDGLNVYTLQKRRDIIFCLICGENITKLTENNDITYKNDVLEHITSKIHVNNINLKTRILQLYTYHNYFTIRGKQHAELQYLLNPFRKERLQCAGCKSSHNLKQIVAHLNECRFLDENIDEKHKEVIENDVAISTSASTSTVSSNNPPPMFYDDETMMALYPTCNTPRGQRRPEILTVQKRTDFEKFCLACCCSLYMRGVEHISSEKHEKMLNKKRVALRAYHNFWMAKKPEIQLKQVYFNPFDDRTMVCIVCRNVDLFRNMMLHSRCINFIRKKNALCMFPEELSEFELNYDKGIVRRFFYGVQYDLSRDILGTQVPVAYVHKRYFHCLLCYNSRVGRMIRNIDMWKNHLYRYHCKPGPARDENLRRVIEFHEYWAAQTAERQVYLCHFTLKNQGVGCDQEHFLPLEKSVEHVEVHTDCQLLKIIQQEENSRENMQHVPNDADNNKNPGGAKHNIVLIYPKAIENGENGAASSSKPTINLPCYLLEHTKYFQAIVGEPDVVNCSICKEMMGNSVKTLRHHVASDKHGQVAHNMHKVKYFCDTCNNDQFFNEKRWMAHLESNDHLHILKNMPEERQIAMTEYYCRRCRLVIFGDEISKIRHEESGARSAKKQQDILTPQMKDLLKSRRHIEQNGQRLLAKCAQFRENSRDKVTQCIGDLETLIKTSYPNCRIYQFGSRVAGFVVEDSDLDLFVDVDNKYLGHDLDYHGERKIVQEVRTLLKSDPRTYIDLHTVLSARVPIVKVVHAPTELDCDLSFINGLSVENTRLIKFYADIQPKFGEAMLLLKEWGACMACKLRNDMTSYALCMMLIFNMQIDRYLPSVHELRMRSTFDVPNINGWDTIDYSKLDQSRIMENFKQPESVADILQSFFEYYSRTFNYAQQVACPLLGRTFSVKSFADKGVNTPEEMHTYREKVAVDPDAQFKVGSHMFVQDPFDLGHNLAKMANQQFVNKFKNLCRLSAMHIKS